MAITFDIEKLNKLLTAYNRCLNITITIFDHKLNCIYDAGDWQPYCLAIGEDENRLAKCKECDLYYAHKARDQHSTVIYTCHAGIAEVVAPVFCDNTIVAYLMLGKFRDAEQKYSSRDIVLEKADEYGLDRDRMLAAFEKLPVFEQSYIDDALLLLQSCISYIVGVENVIMINHPIMAQHIAEYIDEHIDDKLTATVLCDHFHVAKHILYDIFDKNFGTTVQKYIIDKRLELAKKLLTTTDKSLSIIASETGFTDYNYFINTFKKLTGTTPLKYRKKNSFTE